MALLGHFEPGLYLLKQDICLKVALAVQVFLCCQLKSKNQSQMVGKYCMVYQQVVKCWTV